MTLTYQRFTAVVVVVVDLRHSLSEWHLLLSEYDLVYSDLQEQAISHSRSKLSAGRYGLGIRASTWFIRGAGTRVQMIDIISSNLARYLNNYLFP